MALKLSDDQMRRIEQEERVRLAEEQYRAKVREGLVSDPVPSTSRFSRQKLVLLILFAIIAYAVFHSH